MHGLLRALACVLASGSAFAQVNALYSTFGTGCPGTGAGLGDNHVVPAGMATSYGGGNNIIPFTSSPLRYQQVFLGTDLPQAFTMAGLSLRQDENGAGHAIIVDLEIQVGYTTQTPQTLGTTFASNFDSGAPVVVVPRAQITFPNTPARPISPADFFMTIPFTTSFNWVPATGRNFLIQVTVFGNSHNGPWAYPFDATSTGTSRVYGSPATATTGTVQTNYGLVMGLRAPTNTAIPVLYSTSTPKINDTFRVRLSNARASSVAMLWLGVSNSAWGPLPLPLDLAGLGAPGCKLLVSLDVMQPVAIDASGNGSLNYNLPNDIYLMGVRFYNQYLVLDAPANQLGFAFTNGGAGTIGNM